MAKTAPKAKTKKASPNGRKKTTRGPEKKLSKRSKLKAFFWKLFVCVLILVIGFGIAGYLYLTQGLPNHKNFEFRESSFVISQDGEVIGEFFPIEPTERRTVIPISDIQEVTIDAVLAAEDGDFYKHKGLDYVGMLRAAFKLITRGKISGGGSTITQQTVKNMLLTPERKIKRKLKELILARRLEDGLSKDEILSIYLNLIYFGHGRFGIEQAAQYYFGIPASKLDLAQSSVLAGLIQSPERHSPRKHPRSAKTRQKYVLTQMVKRGFIGQKEADAVAKAKLPKLAQVESTPKEYRWILDQVPELLKSEGISDLRGGGYRIYTTINAKWQRAAHRSLTTELDATVRDRLDKKRKVSSRAKWLKKRKSKWGKKNPPLGADVQGIVVDTDDKSAIVDVGKGRYRLGRTDVRRWSSILKRELEPNDVLKIRISKHPRGNRLGKARLSPQPEGSMVVIDPVTGAIKVQVGGYDWENSKFNRATQMQRQLGSTFKPFVYGAALQSRNYTLSTQLIDSPETINLGGGRFYRPKNFTKRHIGPVSLRRALAKSINTTAIRTAVDLSTKTVADFAKKCGLIGKFADGPSMALGALETSPTNLAQAFAPFANGGHHVSPYLITSIAQNERVLEIPPNDTQRVISDGLSFLMKEALVEVVKRGTAARLRNRTESIGGKTGTTNGNRDAWFAAIMPNLVAVTWVGRDDYEAIGKKATGGRVALPVFESFLESARPPLMAFPPKPESVTQLHVDDEGYRLSEDEGSGRGEYYLLGTEPTKRPPKSLSLDDLWTATNDGEGEQPTDQEPDEAAPENTLQLFDLAETPVIKADEERPTPREESEQKSPANRPSKKPFEGKLFDEDKFE